MTSRGKPLLEVTLTDIANGGHAVGQAQGKTIFVPYALPGETVTVRIVDDRGAYAFAEGVSVLDISADRVMPRCPHFGPGRCGGCHWQHIDYPAQLALKTDIVIDQLSRVGHLEDVPVSLALGSPQIYEYQSSALFFPAEGGQLGFKNTARDQIIPIDDCPILTPALYDLLDQLDLDLPTLSRIRLLENGRDDRMLVLSTTDDEAPGLHLDFKASVNLQLSDAVPVNLIGATHLVYEILGRSYRVTAGCFMRGNLPQIETLLRMVQQFLNLRGNESVLDLYCGSGILSGALAPACSLITAVDSFPPAMTDAEENLEDFDHIDLIEGSVADVLWNLPEPESYTAAVLDPPAEGLGNETLAALKNVLPPRLVYIAESPVALARDARQLLKQYGYRLRAVQPIDFEPQTYRVVSVAYFTRGGS